MASAFKVKPSHKAVKSYYAALTTYADQSVKHESALRSAFLNLLSETGRKFGWTLIPELSLNANGHQIRPDGTFRDEFTIEPGYWEAKDTDDRSAHSLFVAAPILFGARTAATPLIPRSQPAEFDLQSTGMFKFPQAHGDQSRRCERRDPGRAPRPLTDVGAFRRVAGAGTFRGLASQGRHVIRGGYNHDVEVRS